MDLKKGNYKKYSCNIKDKNGAFVTNLESAMEITVGLKLDPTQEEYDLSKFLTSGDVVIVEPLSGEISWEFNSYDTEELLPGLYSLACQVDYTPAKQFEIKLQDIDLNSADKIMITQDVIN